MKVVINKTFKDQNKLNASLKSQTKLKQLKNINYKGEPYIPNIIKTHPSMG